MGRTKSRRPTLELVKMLESTGALLWIDRVG